MTASSMIPSSPQKTKTSQTKKKKYKEAKKMEQRIRTALEEGRIEDETLLDGVKLEKVISPASTKQAMIARVSQIPKPCFP
jgi:ubiquitin carboxyl-terminal hydrolase 1